MGWHDRKMREKTKEKEEKRWKKGKKRRGDKRGIEDENGTGRMGRRNFGGK